MYEANRIILMIEATNLSPHWFSLFLGMLFL